MTRSRCAPGFPFSFASGGRVLTVTPAASGNQTRRRPADSGGPQRSPPQFSSRASAVPSAGPHRRRCKAPFWTGTWSQIHWPKGTARCGGHRDSYGRLGPPFPHGSSRASQCRAGHRARDSPAEATSKRRSHRRVRRGETVGRLGGRAGEEEEVERDGGERLGRLSAVHMDWGGRPWRPIG